LKHKSVKSIVIFFQQYFSALQDALIPSGRAIALISSLFFGFTGYSAADAVLSRCRSWRASSLPAPADHRKDVANTGSTARTLILTLVFQHCRCVTRKAVSYLYVCTY
jgi:hypothetical protein